mmetsp:Transcript_16530/g.41758  ORF Transcript_16530/g.41758 Transcript_16530/m.41758 type:complete len:85 (+) Transcript_16530:309-563(+)
MWHCHPLVPRLVSRLAIHKEGKKRVVVWTCGLGILPLLLPLPLVVVHPEKCLPSHPLMIVDIEKAYPNDDYRFCKGRCFFLMHR